MIVAIVLIVAMLATIALTFGKIARSDGWRATVTPLASILGSGFLICGPLLAREFGSAAVGAMAVPLAFALAGALAIVIVWLTGSFEVVALSSRAFALFYALQCMLALAVSIKDGKGSIGQRMDFVAIGLVCLVAAAVGAPAEG